MKTTISFLWSLLKNSETLAVWWLNWRWAKSQSVCNMAVNFRCDFLQLQRQTLGNLSVGFRETRLKLPVLADLVTFRLPNLCATLYYLSLCLFHRFNIFAEYSGVGSMRAPVALLPQFTNFSIIDEWLLNQWVYFMKKKVKNLKNGYFP